MVRAMTATPEYLNVAALTALDDDALLARLRLLRVRIAEHQAVVDGSYDERLNVFRILAARGLRQQDIGEAAGVVGNAVGYALQTHGREPLDA